MDLKPYDNEDDIFCESNADVEYVRDEEYGNYEIKTTELKLLK